MVDSGPWDDYTTQNPDISPTSGPWDDYTTPAASTGISASALPIAPVPQNNIPAVAPPSSAVSTPMPQNNTLPPQGDAISQLRATAADISKPSASEQRNQEMGAPQSYLEGLARGAMQGQLGVQQVLSKIPIVGHALYGSDAENEAQAKMLQEWGKGSGISGTAGEAIGNPVDRASFALAPESLVGRAAVGAGLGALQPVTEEDQRSGHVVEGAALNALVPPVVGKTIEGAGTLAQGIANKTGLISATNWALSKLPESLGASPTTSDLYKAAKSIGLDTSGKSPQDIKDNLQAAFTKSTGDIKDIISGGKELNPVAANTAISNQYDNELAQSNQLYGKVKELGEGKVADASDLLKNTNDLIKEQEARKHLAPEEERAINELKYWRDKITDSSQADTPKSDNVVSLYSTPKTPNLIAFNDVVDLKQALNQNFNPKNFPSRADTPFAKLNSNVNDILDTISKQSDETIKSPETDFSAALDTANKHWTDVARTYKNDLLKQFWTPEDYYESKALTDKGTPLSTTLRKRARGMIDKIQTPEDLETLTDALPPQAGDAVKGAKFQQIMDKAGIDPQSIYDNKDTLDKIFRNNPAASKTLDDITSVMNNLNQKGLGRNLPDNIDLEPNARTDEGIRSLWSVGTGKKLYAIKHALNTISPAEKATGKVLKSFQQEVKSGAPLRKTIKNTASGLAPYISKPAGLISEKEATE